MTTVVTKYPCDHLKSLLDSTTVIDALNNGGVYKLIYLTNQKNQWDETYTYGIDLVYCPQCGKKLDVQFHEESK